MNDISELSKTELADKVKELELQVEVVAYIYTWLLREPLMSIPELCEKVKGMMPDQNVSDEFIIDSLIIAGCGGGIMFFHVPYKGDQLLAGAGIRPKRVLKEGEAYKFNEELSKMRYTPNESQTR